MVKIIKANFLLRVSLISILLSVLIGPNFVVKGEANLEEACRTLAERGCQSLSDSECRRELEKCEDYYKKESARIEADLGKTEQQKKTLQNQIYNLNQKIKNLSYQIYKSNLIIQDLKIQITDTSESIEKTSLSIEESKEKLANILRTIYEEDQKSLVEILLSERKLSDFFDNLVALELLDSKNKDLLENIKILKSNLEGQKVSLDGEKEGLENIVKIQGLQKEESSKTKGEQEYYLNITESEYQKQLKEKQDIQKKASDIRARIFELVGVPTAIAPTFGQAYEIAKYVEGITGVRPAFLLAVLQQESAIGKNVGQCYLKNATTGDGLIVYNGQTVSRVMKPSRDVTPFLQITKELGRDPYSTPVSCPMSFGYGGAMGPAQFIPSTWMLYKGRLEGILGKHADPWSIKDAFLAAGIYLADGGATSQTRNGEWAAAMIYFTGSTKNTQYSWYANNVLKIADGFAADIAILEK